MLLFLMIPLALLAITIAIAPVLAMTIVDARQRTEEPAQSPMTIGAPRPVNVPAGDADGEKLARAA